MLLVRKEKTTPLVVNATREKVKKTTTTVPHVSTRRVKQKATRQKEIGINVNNEEYLEEDETPLVRKWKIIDIVDKESEEEVEKGKPTFKI